MINLLSPNDKRQLAAARTNSLLLRYTILIGVFVVLLQLEMIGAYFILNVGKAQSEALIADNNAKTASYASTKQEALAFRSNLSTAKYILTKQVPYTDLMIAVAQSLPPGTVLDRLLLDPATFGTPTTLTVHTLSQQDAINARQSLLQAKINGKPLFESVSFQSVSATADKASRYPYSATYNVTYSRAVLPT